MKLHGFKYKPRNINILFTHNGMAVHLTRSEGEGFEEVRTSNAVDGTDDDLLWNDSDEDGDVRSE